MTQTKLNDNHGKVGSLSSSSSSSNQKPESVTTNPGGYQKLAKCLVLVLVSCGIASFLGPGSSLFVESSTETNENACDDRLRSLLPILGDDDESFRAARSLPLFLHRNGEVTPCGEVTVGDLLEQLKIDYGAAECPIPLDKYTFESLLTKSFHGVLSDACDSTETYGDKSKGFLGYCDMGEDHTPILVDHNLLVPVSSSGGSTSLPCHFHTREGLRIPQPDWLSDTVRQYNADPDCEGDETTQTCTASNRTKEVHLYAVPAGRVFMFAPSYVGEIFQLPHVALAPGDEPIYMEVLSVQPRVFDIYNFFNKDESKDLVDRALREKSESHRIKRSTTGASDKSVNSRRTSESGFDTTGATAIKLKQRCFAALGFDEYVESYSDGLQILRYNVSKAYNSHMDWIEDLTGQLKHDYDSAGTGGNRFATILLYMSDLGENDGGETVFPKGQPNIPVEERISQNEAREQLRASEQGSVLKPGSWEENLVADCRSQLSIRPHSARAVLFYSQHPNGEEDKNSLHGACPVLQGQKYAANLWVWNTPRTGYPGSPIKKKFQADYGGPVVRPENMKIIASFTNSGQDPAMDNAVLYYGEDRFWEKLGKNSPTITVNTYQGHVWNVKVDDKIVATWKILDKNGQVQKMTI